MLKNNGYPPPPIVFSELWCYTGLRVTVRAKALGFVFRVKVWDLVLRVRISSVRIRARLGKCWV